MAWCWYRLRIRYSIINENQRQLSNRITAPFSDVVVEPYNAILSIHQLLEDSTSDETFVIDDEALCNISHNILKQQPNWVISLVMSGIKASLRFSGKLNGDLRKMCVNLVPFPRLHFFAMAQDPLFAPAHAKHVKVTDEMWSSRNSLANVKPEDGKYLSASCSHCSNLATQEVDDEIAKVSEKMSDDVVTWIPNNTKSIVAVPPEDTPMSGTYVANNTPLKFVFQRVSAQFVKFYKKKASSLV